MFKWAQQQLANVAGTQEPVYGPEAIQSVAKQAEATPFTELTKADLKWKAMDSTCVETHTFYVFADSGHYAMVQLIYNNLAGIRTTTQINTKVFFPDGRAPLWTSEAVSDHKFTNDMTCFHANKASIDLSADGDSYHVKSNASPQTVVDVKFTRRAPGFQAGKDGTSYFGTDAKNPWGSMRHAFWPRCEVEGQFMTKEGVLNMKGRGTFAYCLQGMKPHHLAARWNFCNFSGPTHSAILMEYTTPPSYGSTIVNVGGIVTDDKILYAGVSNSAKHLEHKQDTDVDWPEPTAVTFKWDGKSQGTDAELTAQIPKRTDRIDVMAEVPGFVKQFVGVAVGTRPYIYQYMAKPTLSITQNGSSTQEDGTLFMEATFIS